MWHNGISKFATLALLEEASLFRVIACARRVNHPPTLLSRNTAIVYSPPAPITFPQESNTRTQLDVTQAPQVEGKRKQQSIPYMTFPVNLRSACCDNELETSCQCRSSTKQVENCPKRKQHKVVRQSPINSSQETVFRPNKRKVKDFTR